MVIHTWALTTLFSLSAISWLLLVTKCLWRCHPEKAFLHATEDVLETCISAVITWQMSWQSPIFCWQLLLCEQQYVRTLPSPAVPLISHTYTTQPHSASDQQYIHYPAPQCFWSAIHTLPSPIVLLISNTYTTQPHSASDQQYIHYPAP